MSWAAVAGAAVSVVGGAIANKPDKSAQKYAKKRNAQTDAFVKEMLGGAREDLIGFSQLAQDNANLGFGAGLDVMGQYMPQQFDVFQQGNVGAQNQLITGMPQVHNAILGMPIDYSAFQPQTLNYDTSFTQQQLPEFAGVGDLLGGQTPQSNPYTGGFAGAANRNWPSTGYYQP